MGTNCQDGEGFSEAINVGDGQPLKDIPMSDQEGLHRFCMVGQREGADFQPFDQSTYFVTNVDKTPPERMPVVAFGRWGFTLPYNFPELAGFIHYEPAGEMEACPSDTSDWTNSNQIQINLDQIYLEGKHQACKELL